MTDRERSFLLRTLGHPVLKNPAGGVAEGLRRKDLALLAYLCVERRPHSRSHLAALLWGESPEAKARHSLTQALGRIGKAAGSGALVVERESVLSTGAVECDASWLLAGDERLDPLLGLYDGPFLEGFEAGFGSEEFRDWADERRAELRNAALRWLERTGAAAEAAGDWALALRIGERGTRIDPVWEEAHRRVMRACFQMGERNRALRHFKQLARWLAEEVGGIPDEQTLELARSIRAATIQSPPRAASPVPSAPLVPPAAAAPSPTLEPAAPGPGEAVTEPQPAGAAAGPEPAWTAPEPEPDASLPEPEPDASVPAPGDPLAAPSGSPAPTHGPDEAQGDSAPARDTSKPRLSRDLVRKLAAVVAAAALLWATMEALSRAAAPDEPVPGNGESIRQGKGGAVYLAYAETLWRYPDEPTLSRCLGGWRQRVRQARRLPRWPRRTLPSVTRHRWQGGLSPVVTDHPQDPTQFAAVGCVLAPIPDPLTFRAIFGHTDWTRSVMEPDSLIRASPHTRQADPYRVRPAGTLIQGAGGGVKWIVYHGGALNVAPRVLATYCRTLAEVVRVPDAEFVYYRAFAALPPADPPCHPDRPPCSATAALARDGTRRRCAAQPASEPRP